MADAAPTARPVKTIAIILGSESDWPKVQPVVTTYSEAKIRIVVHVISCHRNPIELLMLVGKCCWGCYDAVICCGGKAFALPGVLDALIHFFNGKTPVVGVALGDPDSDEYLAAMLSIEQLPGQPVIMEQADVPYSGADGLKEAINRVMAGNLPSKERQEKPAKWNFWSNFWQGA